jgi:DNA ligase-1
MEAFAALLDRLYYTHSTLAKAALLKEYLANTSDPDRGYTVAALAGELSFDLFKRHTVRELITERVDPVLYDISRDYVGESSETVAHLWPVSKNAKRLNRLPPLHEVVAEFQQRDKQGVREYLIMLLDNMSAEQRWALLKLGTRGLRVGVSARFIKKVLAEFGGVEVAEVEKLWHALTPPYEELFAWLEGRAEKPDISGKITFNPVMLAHPIEEKELESITPEEFIAEWKYDGIRVQLVSSEQGKALFSRTGDDISHSFPDLLAEISGSFIVDGELIVKRGEQIAPFNDLQQRLGKKKPSGKLMQKHPAHLIVYDLLEDDGEDVRELSLIERQQRLQQWHHQHLLSRISLSEPLPFKTLDDLTAYREQADRSAGNTLEGLMLKRADTPYIPGRPKGYWYKWKRDPLLLDAVLMYAQRGSGKRSSYYSDYTFGLWKEGEILPIGKAYSGFTDAELKKLDQWVRNHTIKRFGPVREVKKELVFEVAFDSAHHSPRHKSGFALRFPRIHRIRWDKPAADADGMEALARIVGLK